MNDTNKPSSGARSTGRAGYEGTGLRHTAAQDADGGPKGRLSRHQSPAIAPALLTDEQAAAFFGISVRKFHELRAEPWAPAPIVLGPRLVRWALIELEAAVQSMPRQTKSEPEPHQLLRGKVEKLKRGGTQ